eukprot:TRINITY_DN5334_c0_g7_i1.p1 TRINITY_DN5334_c0_g7~~TRINITY_DN5334_c0_g7_i1.p1  ORF type:complete len:413 (+),score=46.78 TRINITY_DN5334_c0_g7_i1:47-1285(+)
MAGMTIESINPMELLSKLTSNPRLHEEDAIDADLRSQNDAAPNVTLSPEDIPASSAVLSHARVSAPRDDVDGVSHHQASLPHERNANKAPLVDNTLLTLLLSHPEISALRCAESKLDADNEIVGESMSSSNPSAQKIRPGSSCKAKKNADVMSSHHVWKLEKKRRSREGATEGYSRAGTPLDEQLLLGTTPTPPSVRATSAPLLPAPSMPGPLPPGPVKRAPQSHQRFNLVPAVGGSSEAPKQQASSGMKTFEPHARGRAGVGFAVPPGIHSTEAPEQSAERTTVVLRNIPKTYNTCLVTNLVHSLGFRGKCDFIDVPGNRVSPSTRGCAIVNLVEPADFPIFFETFDGFSQWKSKSKSICRVEWCDQFDCLNDIIERYRKILEECKEISDANKPRLMSNGLPIPFPCVTWQ